MLRYLAGAASMLVLIAAGFFLARTMATAEQPLPAPAAAQGLLDAGSGNGLPAPPEASEKSKEERRFNRYDRDKNGVVARAEYLLSRQKAYAKLDLNGDGMLSFEEFVVKTSDKFKKADRDGSAGLDRAEFASTRTIRKAKASPRCDCSRAAPQPPMAAAADDEES